MTLCNLAQGFLFSTMDTQAVIDHIVEELDTYANNAGIKGFVIGVSGGIDSAVTSVLAARTGKTVLCVEMPIHQAFEQVSRAAEHIEDLRAEFPNVNCEVVKLSDVFDQFVATLPKIENEDALELALVNSRARMRMTTLYYFAGALNFLVVGTGNKVEDFGIGFYTKYGDGGVDISPIADLMKSEVYEIGRALGISQEILSAAPTDGLWGDDRNDEDQIGATYDELEWAMMFSGDERELNDRQHEVLAIFRKANAANQHKMVPIPVIEIPEELRN